MVFSNRGHRAVIIRTLATPFRARPERSEGACAVAKPALQRTDTSNHDIFPSLTLTKQARLSSRAPSGARDLLLVGIYVEGKHIGKATSAQEATPRLLARRQADEDTIVVRNRHLRAPIDTHPRMTEHNSRFAHVKPVREFSMREDVVNTLAW